MASILRLPAELVAQVARDLSDDVRDISALSRSCRTLHSAVTHTLYKYVKDDPNVMCWAVDEGQIRTVERLLAAGADPNVGFVGALSRTLQLKWVRGFDRLFQRTRPMGHYLGQENAVIEHGDEDGHEDVYDVGEEEEEEQEELESDDELEDDSDEDSETSSDGDESFGNQYYWSPLHIAARWGRNDIVDLLLRHGADIHSLSRGFCDCSFTNEPSDHDMKPIQHYPLWMPLHTAICSGNDSTARLLLSRGASTNVSTRCFGWESAQVTALHTACFSDSVSFSRFLVESGYQVNVEVRDHMGYTPMSYAYHNGNWASMDFLLEQGATLDARLGCFSLIKHACFYGRYAEAARLLELGANIDTNFEETENPASALSVCCITIKPIAGRKSGLQVPANHQRHIRLDVIKTLIKMRTNREADANLSSAFLNASQSHLPDVVQLLLNEGADINARDRDGLSALEVACASRISRVQGPMLRTVQILLSRTDVVQDGHKALEKLCTNSVRNRDKEPIAQLLLENGAAASLERRSGQKLLSSSIASGNFQLSEAFLDAGLRRPASRELMAIIGRVIAVDNNLALEYLLTRFPDSEPFMLTGRRLFDALKAGKERCAQFLTEMEAPIDFQQDGETSLFHACSLKDPWVAEMLLDRGADPNACTDAGDYPMLFAMLDGNTELITLLLDNGARIHQHPDGETTLGPLDFAITIGNIEAVKAMVDHPSYIQSSTQEERDEHLLTACFTGAANFGNGEILSTLLWSGGSNPDVVFRSTNSSPLHFAIVTANKLAITLLMENGADIHLKLVHPDDPHGSVRPFARGSGNPFANTTPLEFALRHGELGIVEHMMRKDDRFPHFPGIPLAHYMRAACYRLNRKLIAALLRHGVSFDIQAEDGNAPLAMICEGLDEYVDDEEWEPSLVALRSASCIQLLLETGSDPSIKNHAGESGLDQMRRRMSYAGTNDFNVELARCWNSCFIISENRIEQRAGH